MGSNRRFFGSSGGAAGSVGCWLSVTAALAQALVDVARNDARLASPGGERPRAPCASGACCRPRPGTRARWRRRDRAPEVSEQLAVDRDSLGATTLPDVAVVGPADDDQPWVEVHVRLPQGEQL